MTSFTWTRLNPLARHHWHSDGTAELRDSLNAEISKVLNKRAEIDKLWRDCGDADVSEISFEQLKAAEKARELRFNLLQAEVELRKRLTEFYNIQSREGNEHITKLSDKLGALPKSIGERLEDAGYMCPEANKPVQGAWNQGMVNMHPEMIFTRQEISGVRSVTGSQDCNPANLDGIREATEQLDRIRQAMTAS